MGSDWSDVALPDDLHNRLTEAVKTYNVTEIEEGLQRLAMLGGEAEKLANHLRELRRQYDMAAMLEILRRIG